MKLYVDELPKCCAECEWFTPNHCGNKNERNFCLVARMPFYNTEEERKIRRGQHKDSCSDFDCPLHSLAKHDKQVRKQVCDDIRKQIKPYYGEEISGFVAENILDQIDKGGGNAERKKSESNSR